ncbi:MAG: hypothetical protein ABSG46_01575 [Candidatus Binataceae bacterium]|jgi:hypothetical protein
MRFSTRLVVGIIALIAVPVVALAQDDSGVGTNPQVPQPEQSSGVNWKGVGVGAGTVIGNAIYMPAKLLYGIGGGIVGGAGYLLTGGNKQVSNTIWRSSLGGDYVLTPDMVAGKQPVHFSGPTATVPQSSDADDGTAVATSNGNSLSPAPAGTSIPPSAPRPIDNGAGAVGGSSSSRRMPDTSIE